MIFIRHEADGKVLAYGKYTNQFPQDEANVLFVEHGFIFPDEIQTFGKVGIMYIDTITKDISYVYVNRPLTPDEELVQLKQQMVAQQSAINMLLGV